jgi:hypothetical protein
MTAVKCKQEYKTLLDFSKTDRRVSKNLVKQLLRQAELPSYQRDDKSITHINHDIIVGIYKIRLSLCNEFDAQKNKLKQYGNFSFNIMELTSSGDEYGAAYVLLPPRDKLFKNQYWYYNDKLRINDLANAIIYCSRVSNLKAFS